MAQRNPNPDGSRGSFFAAPKYRKRYNSPEEEQHAQDNLRYAKALLEDAPEVANDDVPRETCETLDDHDWQESDRYLHTVVCSKCNRMIEHPAKWYAEHPETAHNPPQNDTPPPEAYE